MNTMTKSLITYLTENWNPVSNPQAGFTFQYNGLNCEIWLNTHKSYQTLTVKNEDGLIDQFQINLFRESSHGNPFVNKISDSLKGGFIELTPITLKRKDYGVVFKTRDTDVG